VAFLDQLAGVLPDGPAGRGPCSIPPAFPVRPGMAHRCHRGNTVLVRETLHRCPSVGRPGLNLCWRMCAPAETGGAAGRGRLAVAAIRAVYAWNRWGMCCSPCSPPTCLLRLFSTASLLLGLRTPGSGPAGSGARCEVELAGDDLGPCQLTAPWSELKSLSRRLRYM